MNRRPRGFCLEKAISTFWIIQEKTVLPQKLWVTIRCSGVLGAVFPGIFGDLTRITFWEREI